MTKERDLHEERVPLWGQLGFSAEEWSKFTKTERKIIVIVRKYHVEDEERIRAMLDFPFTMKKSTYRVHKCRVFKKMAAIKAGRWVP